MAGQAAEFDLLIKLSLSLSLFLLLLFLSYSPSFIGQL